MSSGKLPVLAAVFSLFLLVRVTSATSFAQADKSVILATTTSIQDTGLLDALIPVFEKQTGYIVKTISVGSGQALKMGEKGEADVLLAHSPDAEKKLVEQGFAVNRRLVMHNDLVIVGPADDPAAIRGIRSARDALRKIAQSARVTFFSRGDNSGTHVLETMLWKAAGLNVEGRSWYQQTGLGMGQTLDICAEKKAYTLVDRGTYIVSKKRLGLDILVEGDPLLLNVYHVMEVNPAKWPRVNSAGARAFTDFMVSKRAQEIIRSFGAGKFGSPIFFPDAGNKALERF